MVNVTLTDNISKLQNKYLKCCYEYLLRDVENHKSEQP